MRTGHVFGIIVVFVLFVISIACQKQHGGKVGGVDVSREKLKEWMDQKLDVRILDVRSKKEYESGHVPNAMNIDYTEISARLSELEPYKNHKIVVYCRSGRRSGIAEKTLKEAGFSDIYHLTGDMIGWEKAGWPTEPRD
jgi:phage shock protein E